MKASASLLVVVVAIAALPALAAPGSSSPTIKKCRDATGKWHYGDTAAKACAHSKVTEMSEQGVKKREIAAPLTEAELKQREEKQAEVDQAKEQAKRDELLLATYAHEADIIYIRDRKIAQLQSMIKASTDTLNPLRATLTRLEAQAEAEQKSSKAVSEQTAKALEQTRAQIARHETVIVQKRQEQEAVKAQAEKDLERYRALKSSGARTSAK